MRFSLESLSPCTTPHASAMRRLSTTSSYSSAISPIDVDDDSVDDSEPQPPCVHEASFFDRPSLFNRSFSNIGNKNNDTNKGLPHQCSGDNARIQSEHKDDTEEADGKQLPLNYFFNAETRSTDKQRSRDSSSLGRSSSHSSPLEDELSEVISAARTSICGKEYDRCELEFRRDRVNLTIWKESNPRWQGEVKYAHILRFCFSRVDRPPYILLLQLDDAKGRSDFATFFDSIFAKACEENDLKAQTVPKVYGVVFFFDEVMDYMRCQSMADSNPRLMNFFREELSESEVRQFLKLDSSQLLRYSHYSEVKGSLPCGARGQSLAKLMGNGARQAFGGMTAFFRPTARSSVLEQDGNIAVVVRSNFSQDRRLNMSGNKTEVSSTGIGEKKLPISIASVGKQELEAGDGSVDKSVVFVSNRPYEQSDTKTSAMGACSLQQIEKQSEIMERKERAALTGWRENDKVKRRKIESRRNEELLEYPYDSSDTLGRISVTLGDVDRLVPGEFLNDNIIDFYLRFLWRHLDSLQQQQMYFFTSHFFSQLNGTNGAHELSTADPDERFARVARWTQKETNLFDKRFLFIPINDSFHWSIAVFCNPGSAIIKKHRKMRRRSQVTSDARRLDPREVVDLVHIDGGSSQSGGSTESLGIVGSNADEEIEEVELKSCQEDRLAYPPCLLFLDSLRCHRKKKFTNMLRDYLECEYKARFASSSADSVRKEKSAVGSEEIDAQGDIITVFDPDSIRILEPNIPLQRNSSDCGVFLLMYAVSIVRLFPFGVTREDLEGNLKSTLAPDMFRDEHVLEFREYLQQLIFCLQFLEKHGLPEQNVKEEGLESFAID